MAKTKTPKSSKKASSRVSTGGKESPKPKAKHGEIRKAHINDVHQKLKHALNKHKIPGADNLIPKLLGICKFNQEMIKELVNSAQDSHIGNQVAEELFYTTIRLDHYAKEMLRKVMQKNASKKDDDPSKEKVDFLNTMYRLDAEFLVRVEPKIKRPYKKQTTTSRRKSQEITVRDTSKLEIRVSDIKSQLKAIRGKTIKMHQENAKKAKKAYFKAIRQYRELHPMEEEDDEDMTVADYDKKEKEATAELKGKWEGAKQNVVAKERELRKLEAEKTRLDKKIQEISDLAQYESSDSDSGSGDEEEGEVHPATPGDSVADESGDESGDESDDESGDFEAEPSQTQLED
jgi:hypothetical protein